MHLNEKARGIVNVCESLSYISLDVKVLLTELICDLFCISDNLFKDGVKRVCADTNVMQLRI